MLNTYLNIKLNSVEVKFFIASEFFKIYNRVK